MKYVISYQDPHKHFVDIELTIDNVSADKIYLQLPAWRPGRYELQNFAKNIQKIEVIDAKGLSLPFRKITRERWEVDTSGSKKVIVKYNYYAHQMDAGGCWLDEEQLYINFICCSLYMLGRENDPCEVKLKVPKNYAIACGLTQNGSTLLANDYYQLVDSPLVASASLQHKTFQIDEYDFHLWVQGEVDLNWNVILNDFKRFTQEQIKTMGDFPEKDYHFIFQLLPYKHYHGVEHRNSTIITLGPAEHINYDGLYKEFLSISCHELFHAWNVIKIRPIEMFPYDFTKENYFKSGFVIEGITTYYGELFLARSGGFTLEQYFDELNTLFKRHFENFGNENMSVADSSFDLWVDGYTSGIPGRKVSIYVKGAFIALILDIEILQATSNTKSLDDVMQSLYNDFAKKNKGITMEDFQATVEKITGRSFQNFFDECVFGANTLEKRLESALNYVGCKLDISEPKLISEKVFGLRVTHKEGRTYVDSMEPGSPADMVLSKEDEIIAIDSFKVTGGINEQIGKKKKIELSIFRKNKLLSVFLEADKKTFYKQYKIKKNEKAKSEEKINFKRWLKLDW